MNLEEAILKTKEETDYDLKEKMFQEVMRLAWEETEKILKADPFFCMHPREYLYRKLCGLPVRCKP